MRSAADASAARCPSRACAAFSWLTVPSSGPVRACGILLPALVSPVVGDSDPDGTAAELVAGPLDCAGAPDGAAENGPSLRKLGILLAVERLVLAPGMVEVAQNAP